MIKASVIYIGVTILLALVDAIRIKVKWGKVGNIDHDLSRSLALGSIGIVDALSILHTEMFGWVWILRYCIIFISLAAIRFAFYDLCLNLLRIITKTNPTMRLDYVSVKTSSYEDQHSEKIGFWQKRIFSVGAWFTLCGIYYLIFKSW